MKTRLLALLCIILSLVVGIVHGPVAAIFFATISGAMLMPSGLGYCHAVGPLNLLDIALRNGKGVHALIEGVVTYAPELMTFGTVPMAGITYATLTNTALPSGDFRKVGGGVPLQKSEWKREVGSMFPFEAQMRVPEDVVMIARSQNADLTDGDVLASEAIRTVRGSALRIGSQTWYGTKISADGFAGLSTQVDTAKYELNAGGATNADTSSVYLVYLDANPVNPEGVHYVLGNNGSMTLSPTWGKQQIETEPGKFASVHTNNFLSALGLVVPRTEIVLKVKNVKSGNSFTDSIGAELKSKIPLGLRGDLSKWRWFMNSTAHYLLHQSRITIAQNGAGAAYVPEPVDVCGIKIQLTDSLITTERNGLKA